MIKEHVPAIHPVSNIVLSSGLGSGHKTLAPQDYPFRLLYHELAVDRLCAQGFTPGRFFRDTSDTISDPADSFDLPWARVTIPESVFVMYLF